MCSMDSEMLLHPDLLTSEVLMQVIKERKVKINDIESMTRESLLQLFNKFCLPHPQRKARNNLTAGVNQTVEEMQNNNFNNDILISSKMKTATLNSHPGVPVTNLEYNEQVSKRLKLTINSNVNMAEEIKDVISNKRKMMNEIDSPTESDSFGKKQRKPISWP